MAENLKQYADMVGPFKVRPFSLPFIFLNWMKAVSLFVDWALSHQDVWETRWFATDANGSAASSFVNTNTRSLHTVIVFFSYEKNFPTLGSKTWKRSLFRPINI